MEIKIPLLLSTIAVVHPMTHLVIVNLHIQLNLSLLEEKEEKKNLKDVVILTLLVAMLAKLTLPKLNIVLLSQVTLVAMTLGKKNAVSKISPHVKHVKLV